MFEVPPNTIARPANRAIAHPVRIAREFATSRENWLHHKLRYDPDRRWVGLLERTAEHEAWLMSWLPGQSTELHDHGGATGAFTVIYGTLTERVIRAGDTGSAAEELHSIAGGQSRVFGPDYVHQVRNDGPDPAISVHVYRPARTRMRLYTVDPVSGLTPA